MNLAELRRYREPKVPETLAEAEGRMAALEKDIQGARDARSRLHVDEVFWRIEQGKLFDEAKSFFKHGKNPAAHFAQKAGIHERTLYDAAAAYRRAGSMWGFREQVARWEDEGRDITWRMVRNWGRKLLPDDTDKMKEATQKQLASIERRLTRVAQDAAELSEQLPDMDEEERDEVRGVITHAIEQIHEVNREQARILTRVQGGPEPTHHTDDAYLDYVCSKPCINCGGAPSDPYHVNQGGEATEGSAYFVLPVCITCHQQIREHGEEAVLGDWDQWKCLARLLSGYIRSLSDHIRCKQIA